uniref:GATA-type domain-containing protein n=1 Tax=Rhabditophanes sp. KR3021 TaxID=114890 RepID=A0AC35TJ16_9BILA
MGGSEDVSYQKSSSNAMYRSGRNVRTVSPQEAVHFTTFDYRSHCNRQSGDLMYCQQMPGRQVGPSTSVLPSYYPSQDYHHYGHNNNVPSTYSGGQHFMNSSSYSNTPSPKSPITGETYYPQYYLPSVYPCTSHLPPPSSTTATGVKVRGTKVCKKPPMHLNSTCVTCGTAETTLWRRDRNGLAECNPCNLYFRTHKVNRPSRLFRKGRPKKRQGKEKKESKVETLNGNVPYWESPQSVASLESIPPTQPVQQYEMYDYFPYNHHYPIYQQH